MSQSPIRVLITDDHSIVRKGIRALLATEPDIEVVGEAGDGAEAAAQAQVLRPDVILMDLVMPKVDGIEATRRILAQQPGMVQAIHQVHRGEPSLEPSIARKVLMELSQPPTKTPLTAEPLTGREVDVLRLVAQGRSNRDIAEELVITEMTVRTHVSNILSKLHLASRTQAALYALREGLASLDDVPPPE
jgi:NarL family two-component system response regulator LiaR